LLTGTCSQGKQQIIWKGIDDKGEAAGSGVYYIRLNIDGKKSMFRKSLLLK
jgi:flagellar hook assembly protein FlgD